MKSKKCTRCRKQKPLTEFYPHKRGRHRYLRPDCKTCNKAKVKARFTGSMREAALVKRRAATKARLDRLRQTNPELLRERTRRGTLAKSLKQFGLTRAEFDRMCAAQEHRCAICRQPMAALRSRVNIDHDHATGKIRGLLCNRCNRGLGYLKDSPANLQRAIEYLQRST